MNRDAETVPARHETPDVAELRRLYEAAMCVGANEMAWDEWTTAISEAADALLDAAAERDALAEEWAYKGAELREEGHECGHTFRIQVSGRGHSCGVITDNPPTHSDADWWHDDGTVEIRAHNLRDALLLAAGLPMSAWPGLNDDEEPQP